MTKLGFLGAGKMATALARGLIAQGVYTAGELLAVDVKEAARAQFTASTGVACVADPGELVRQSPVLLLAVKPQDTAALLSGFHGQLGEKLLISIAAGLAIARLSTWTGSARVVRVMPNTPAMVNLGASVFACGAAVTPADRALTQRLFSSVGIAMELPEDALDAVTGVSGSGPAYVFEFTQGLIDAAVAAGLPPAVAKALVIQTLAGAAEMLRQDLGTPDDLRNAVTSPGGTTAAGLKVLADAGFRPLLTQVVARATARSRELGQAAK